MLGSKAAKVAAPSAKDRRREDTAMLAIPPEEGDGAG
jgi:hypothetical protein